MLMEASREARGYAYYLECGEEFEEKTAFVVIVPSHSEPGRRYRVDLGLPACECKDYQIHGRLEGEACYHIWAAASFKAAKRIERGMRRIQNRSNRSYRRRGV